MPAISTCTGTIPASSWGGVLEPGSYTVHSRFESVINFVREPAGGSPGVAAFSSDGPSLLSLVTARTGAGPFNIVLPDGALPYCRSAVALTVESGPGTDPCFCCLEFSVPLTIQLIPDRRYDPSWCCRPRSLSALHAAIQRLRSLACLWNEPGSLLMAVDFPDSRDIRGSSVQDAVLESVRKAVQCLHSGEIERCVNRLNGLGFGLTPAGDDFICGVLWASWLADPVQPAASRALRTRIAGASVTTNLISGAQISAAVRGWFTEPAKHLMETLARGDADAVVDAAGPVFAAGQSSGRDTVAGLLAGWTYLEGDGHDCQGYH